MIPAGPTTPLKARPRGTVTAILGISAFYHDSAAALVVDGEIVAAAQEERFTRASTTPASPPSAVAYCLREAGLGPDRLDYVAFYEKPLTKFERLLETYLAFAPRGFRSFRMAMPVWLKDKLYLRRAPPPRPRRPGPTRRSSSPTTTRATPPARSSPARSTRPPSSPSTASASGPRPRGASARGNRIRLTAPPHVPALARPALLGVHLLLRLQGQQRRVQADGPGPLRPARLRRTRSAST